LSAPAAEGGGKNSLHPLRPEERLIVALDVPTPDEARGLIRALRPTVCFYKIGLELLYGGGLALVEEIAADGAHVFIDAKLLDIDNTVEKATANIARLGATFLTIHGQDRKTLDAANRGRGSSQLKLLAITVLTNLDSNDVREQGIAMEPDNLVLQRAGLAVQSGVDGVVASGHEARRIRQRFPDLTIVTPGIRPEGAELNDQTRVMTPGRAMDAGADYLVVGRPITRASDPRRAADAIIAEIATAL